MKKEEKLKILKSVLELEVKKGHLKWTITELARKSQVSRPSIYYHFGNTKSDIVKFAVDLMGEEFFNLSSENDFFHNGIDFSKSVKKTRQKLQKSHYVLTFYFFWRYKDSPIRSYLEEMEFKFQKRVKKLLPYLSQKEVVGVHTILFGIVVSPFLSDGIAFESALSALSNDLKIKFKKSLLIS